MLIVLQRLLLFHLLFWVFLPVSLADNAPVIGNIKIGVLAFRGPQHAINKWNPTVSYLGEVLPEYLFQIVPLDLENLEQATRNGEVDFIITNPGNYVSLETAYGASRIATLQNSHRDTTYTRYGAVIISKKSRIDIRSLADLRGKSFMAISPGAFGGFQMAWLQLRKAGIEPHQDFKEIRYSGFPQDIVVNAVIAGEIDAGTVRAETLARMGTEGKIDLSEINILNVRHTKDYPFPHSTDLYPEWAFAKLKNTPDDLSKEITIALLNYTQIDMLDSQAYAWAIPLDYSPVHELFKTLHIGPYSDIGKITISAVISKYAYWIIMIIIVLITMMAIISYVVSINRRLAHSRQQLTEHQQILENRVSERTEELRQSNIALEEDIVIRRHAEDALRKSKVILQSIHEITTDPSTSFNDKLSALLKAGCQHFQLSDGRLSRIADSQYEIVLHYDADSKKFDQGTMLNVSETICNLTVQESGTLAIKEVNTESPDAQILFEKNKLQCYFGVPVYMDNELYGTLCFSSHASRAKDFESVDHDILQLMAQWIGNELVRQRTSETASRHQNELEHASRLGTLGELASGLAHELNQPLTAITNYLKGFQRRIGTQSLDIEVINPVIEKAVIEAERAAMIIKHMREFIQKRELEHVPVNLDEIIENSINIVRSADSANNINFNTNLDNDPLTLNADRIQLEQVLINLLINSSEAIQDTRGQGDITVSSAFIEKYAVIEVVDNGPGVTDEFLAHIFSPFETTKSNGLGLGLSISRTIIESLQGNITAVNLPEGGLKMTIRLPCET